MLYFSVLWVLKYTDYITRPKKSSWAINWLAIGLLVDCREDWSLRAERGVLVLRGDKIVAR